MNKGGGVEMKRHPLRVFLSLAMFRNTFQVDRFNDSLDSYLFCTVLGQSHFKSGTKRYEMDTSSE